MTVPSQNAENQPQSNEKEINFRAMQAKYERELEAERRARQQAEEKAASLERSRHTAPKEEEEDDSDDQPYVDKRVLSKTLNKFAQGFEQKIEKKAEEKARAMLQEERQLNYMRQNPDFHSVMSSDNIQKFAEKYPSIAENILENVPEGFGRQKLLYQTMKDMGIGKKEEPKPNIQEIIDKNKQTPFQPSSWGSAYQGQKGDFSPAGQKAAYERTQQLIQGRRG